MVCNVLVTNGNRQKCLNLKKSIWTNLKKIGTNLQQNGKKMLMGGIVEWWIQIHLRADRLEKCLGGVN